MFGFAVFLSDSADTKYSCPVVKPMTKVTLKGGLKAGDFTDTGKVGSIKECYATCCQQASCNLAFMLGQNCFSVKCYNKDLCSTIPAQPSIFNPQIAYVWSRKEISGGKSYVLYHTTAILNKKKPRGLLHTMMLIVLSR